MVVHYDVLVAGLGAWGSVALYHCARRGKRTLGFVRFAPPEAPSYTPMMQRSYELWGQLAAEWRGPLIDKVGAVYGAPPDEEIVAGSVASFAEAMCRTKSWRPARHAATPLADHRRW